LRLQRPVRSNKYWITLGIVIILGTSIVMLSSYYLYAAESSFRPKEIYPTKQGGREWYFDNTNPLDDKVFDPGTKISKSHDGSWLVGGDGNDKGQVRMNVITPAGQEEWKNVEITGYVKVVGAISDDDDSVEGSPTPISAIDWYARGGRHSDSIPCEGTSLKGILRVNGMAAWQKEIWHTGGYTDTRAVLNATNPILDRWIGWKVAIYNVNNGTAVKMEAYIDENADNTWRKVNEVLDNGGWAANSPDSVFYSVDCNRSKDYVITNSGPIVTFRSDNIIWQFRDLSVREINGQ